MNIFKTKKSSSLLNFLKYSFLTSALLVLFFSVVFFNSFIKIIKANDPVLSVSNPTETSIDFVATGLIGRDPSRYKIVVDPIDPNADDTIIYSLLNIRTNGTAYETGDGLLSNTAYAAYIKDTTVVTPPEQMVVPFTTLPASPIIISGLTSEAVTLTAHGLLLNKKGVVFELNGNNSVPTESDNNGEASADFSGLTPDTEYNATVYYSGQNIVLKSIKFITAKESNPGSDVTLEVQDSSLTSTGVTLNALDLDPNKKSVTFFVESLDKQNPDSNSGQAQIDELGEATKNFSGLKKGTHYMGKIAYSDDLTNILNIVPFLTLEEDPITIIGTGNDIIAPSTTTTTKTLTSTGKKGVLVPCSGSNCGFNELMTLVNNVINYIFIVFAVPIAAIMFAYAGFLIVTSAGSKESREKAKSIFYNVALGLFFIGASWLIVHVIFGIIGYNGSWIGL